MTEESVLNKTYTAEVIQYLMPDGRQRNVLTELPESSRIDYVDMQRAKCRFEIEILRNGLVSVTITSADEDVDIEVIPNGPEVQPAMVKMLARRLWNMIMTEAHEQHKRDFPKRR